MRLLIEAGADLDKANNDGWTPLWIASQNGHLEVVRLLVEAGADMYMAVNTGGGAVTPLWIARRRDHDDIVWILLRAGATR